MSDRMQGYPSPIPGGLDHVANAQTVRQRTPVPDSSPEIKDLNAHGVPPGTHTSRERSELERGPNLSHGPAPHLQEPGPPTPVPVPVYVVANQDATNSWRSAAPHHFQLPASTGDAVRLCGRDPRRTNVYLLNESSSSNIRFAKTIQDLNNGGGALLPWPLNSYLKLETQDELYALSADSGTPIISVIQEFNTQGSDE
jgi:hypothetical protein